ncbi:hypothetical protein EK599_05420 [Vibrio sp. T187]|uniref:hypothetical protein n=1 Tax=Vibrio TaxID=662 RepID=UPI0010C9420B|nr:MULTISPECIES: hypothetical protein [Vibrio]MBW3695121.1 hypothetical protein [Vibrio sp. T187]
MAVQPKHQDRHGQIGFETDFTTEQRHRFTEVANEAVERRKEREELGYNFIKSAKDTALKPVVKPKKSKPNRARQVIWLIVIGFFSLWVMYMTS